MEAEAGTSKAIFLFNHFQYQHSSANSYKIRLAVHNKEQKKVINHQNQRKIEFFIKEVELIF